MLCAMRCVSEACYDQTYGPPAEEVRQCYLASADLGLSADWLLAHATGTVEMNAVGSCLRDRQLEEGEIDKSRENQYNRCVKAEARSWK